MLICCSCSCVPISFTVVFTLGGWRNTISIDSFLVCFCLFEIFGHFDKMELCIIHVHNYRSGKKRSHVSHYLIIVMLYKGGGEIRIHYFKVIYLIELNHDILTFCHFINIVMWNYYLIHCWSDNETWVSITVLQVGRLKSKNVSQLFLNNCFLSLHQTHFQKMCLALRVSNCFIEIETLSSDRKSVV